MADANPVAGYTGGDLPPNVHLGEGSVIIGAGTFKRFLSRQSNALSFGRYSRAENVIFAVGERGQVQIGSYCYLCDCTLLAEQNISVGDYVMIGWGTTIADSDFHPLGPAERIRDAIALSPVSSGLHRPTIQCSAVTIGSDVYIGPACTIFKGVNIGDGAFVEPGSVVTRDVPKHAHVAGNPAIIIV